MSRSVRINGFDLADKWDPEVYDDKDGRPYIWIEFKHFPPDVVINKGHDNADFADAMEAFIGCPVVSEDRELFLIERPRSDTFDRIVTFLREYAGLT